MWLVWSVTGVKGYCSVTGVKYDCDVTGVKCDCGVKCDWCKECVWGGGGGGGGGKQRGLVVFLDHYSW